MRGLLRYAAADGQAMGLEPLEGIPRRPDGCVSARGAIKGRRSGRLACATGRACQGSRRPGPVEALHLPYAGEATAARPGGRHSTCGRIVQWDDLSTLVTEQRGDARLPRPTAPRLSNSPCGHGDLQSRRSISSSKACMRLLRRSIAMRSPVSNVIAFVTRLLAPGEPTRSLPRLAGRPQPACQQPGNVPLNLLIASTALSGVAFSTIRNSAEAPGWTIPWTCSMNALSMLAQVGSHSKGTVDHLVS